MLWLGCNLNFVKQSFKKQLIKKQTYKSRHLKVHLKSSPCKSRHLKVHLKSKQPFQSLLPVGEPPQSMEHTSKTLDTLLLLTGEKHLYIVDSFLHNFESKFWYCSQTPFQFRHKLNIVCTKIWPFFTVTVILSYCIWFWVNTFKIVDHQPRFSVGSCQLTVNKCTDSVCQVTVHFRWIYWTMFHPTGPISFQLRLDFSSMTLAQPESTDNKCSDDQFIGESEHGQKTNKQTNKHCWP